MTYTLNRDDAQGQRALVRSLVQRGVVSKVDASKKMQTMNLRLRSGATPTNVEHWERYGVTYNPREGAEVLAMAIGGDPDHLAVIDAADRRYRMTELKSGELAVHDDQGQMVHFKRGGIHVKSAKGLTLECSAGITIVGDITHTGDYNQNGVHVDSNGPHTA